MTTYITQDDCCPHADGTWTVRTISLEEFKQLAQAVLFPDSREVVLSRIHDAILQSEIQMFTEVLLPLSTKATPFEEMVPGDSYVIASTPAVVQAMSDQSSLMRVTLEQLPE